MNLFVSYTPDETKFLLEIENKKIEIKHNLFRGVNKEKLAYFKQETVEKKEIIEEFDFIFIKKGKLGVIEKGKIIKILKENECFGYLKKFLDKEYILIALEKSEIIKFDIGEDIELTKNLLRYISERVEEII